ncbi:C2H2-type zinc finger family protein [Hirschfeldia incana]|nr:C2H2-type zinc finger family protein [Hirschfeldia incana]
MEAFEEAIAASKEQSLIFKGKRTKRQRPQSPIPFSIAPPIVTSHARNIEEGSKKEGVITSSSSSASWFSNNNATPKIQEDDEEQDIANCLILLSQGHSLPIPNQEANNNNTYRFSSRRFLETSSSDGGGKAGYYVYQCKTCDRTFPSFQALGGHRASHKKPKATLSLYSNIDVKKNIYESDAVSLVTTSTIYNKNNNNRSVAVYGKAGSSKVHECGVCGAEFTSGQALGGHMRRHRGAVVVAAVPAAHTVTVAAAAANTELSLSSMSFDQFSDGQDHLVMPATKRAKKTVVSLDLDLNLLPTPEDENRVNGFTFALKQKQEQEHQPTQQREEPKCLLMTAPTLVDCHY